MTILHPKVALRRERQASGTQSVGDLIFCVSRRSLLSRNLYHVVASVFKLDVSKNATSRLGRVVLSLLVQLFPTTASSYQLAVCLAA